MTIRQRSVIDGMEALGKQWIAVHHDVRGCTVPEYSEQALLHDKNCEIPMCDPILVEKGQALCCMKEITSMLDAE